MSMLNMECPICTEVFKTADNIYSTNCGHIFHLDCLNEWHARAINCPKCCHPNPTSHKLYLSFDEVEQVSPEKMKEIELKLETSYEKNAELLEQLDEAECNFLQLQEQFTVSEQAKKDLEQKINEINYSDDNFLHLQAQYTETLELNKQLKDQIHELSNENECKTKDLKLKCSEIDSLKAEMENCPVTSADCIQNEKIRILEQKLKHIYGELEREITTNSKLSIENFKLQSCVDHLKSVETTKNIVPKPVKKISKTSENQNKENVAKDSSDNNPKSNNAAATKIFVQELPWNQLAVPLTDVILNLASVMNLSMSADDVVKVNLVANNKQNSPTAELLVEFKSTALKTKFLANKSFLKKLPSTRYIEIKEYLDDKQLSLFTYAKQKLKDNGYNHFFCKNNKVFVKINRSHPKVILVNSKAQVDRLLNNKSSQSEAEVPQELIGKSVDDNYYQL